MAVRATQEDVRKQKLIDAPHSPLLSAYMSNKP